MSSHTLMGHEAEIIIPGSFVVLQGSSGDGMRNTLATHPDWSSEWVDILRQPTNHNTERTAPTSSGSNNRQSRQRVSSSLTCTQDPNTSGSSNLEQWNDLVMEDATHTNSSTPLSACHPPQPQPAADGTEDDTTIMPTVGHLAAQNRTLGGLTSQWNQTAAEDEDDTNFVLVTDQEDEEGPFHVASTLSARRKAQAQIALETWEGECRAREDSQRDEWKDVYRQMVALNRRSSLTSSTTSSSAVSMSSSIEHTFWRTSYNGVATSPNSSPAWWLVDHGKLAILRELPKKLSTGAVLKSVIGTLSPGCTIVATEIVYLNSKTLQQVQVFPSLSSGGRAPHNIYPRGKLGWICLVKVDAFHGQKRTGYAVASIDGYPLLGPGLPSMYNLSPDVWIWRVTCPAGAFVREGLELNTRHRETLPYGSLVRVTRRTVNSQGLCRLRVSAVVDDDGTQVARTGGLNRRESASGSSSKTRLIEGWCSERLNPLSGNRGMVLEPLALPVPAIYRVCLQEGAVVRSGKELSTPQIGHVAFGSVVKVVTRAFSEHPVDQCLERLQLAGGGGWISVRLNRPPPHNDMVVELMEVDSSFNPDTPHLYHWKALQDRLDAQAISHQSSDDVVRNNSNDLDELSSIDSDGVGQASSPAGRFARVPSDNPHLKSTGLKNEPANPAPAHESSRNCVICLSEERNATMVHGETGHIACCLDCARILKARGDKCPVCRLPIERVIQHFFS